MKPVLFAGPSLYRFADPALAEFDIRPPAKSGDILCAVLEGVTRIGLIDGQFETAPSVWHKELLAGLDRGVVIYGAASLGALRACECAEFGMIGIGRIFDQYRIGERTSDADVALVFGPAETGYMPLSLTMADADFIIDEIAEAGDISERGIFSLRSSARSFHYKERKWEDVISAAVLEDRERKSVLKFVEGYCPCQKQRDAVMLISAMISDEIHVSRSKRPRKWILSKTSYLMSLYAREHEKLLLQNSS